MRSSAVMTREVIVAPPGLALGAASRLMKRMRFRHLPVVADGRLCGILSDRDLLERGVDTEWGDPDLSCAEAMTPAPITCSPDATVGAVAGLMLEHRIDAIPIVNSAGGLVGLVTTTDLLWLLADRREPAKLPFDFHLNVVDQASAEASA